LRKEDRIGRGAYAVGGGGKDDQLAQKGYVPGSVPPPTICIADLSGGLIMKSIIGLCLGGGQKAQERQYGQVIVEQAYDLKAALRSAYTALTGSV